MHSLSPLFPLPHARIKGRGTWRGTCLSFKSVQLSSLEGHFRAVPLMQPLPLTPCGFALCRAESGARRYLHVPPASSHSVFFSVTQERSARHMHYLQDLVFKIHQNSLTSATKLPHTSNKPLQFSIHHSHQWYKILRNPQCDTISVLQDNQVLQERLFGGIKSPSERDSLRTIHSALNHHQ